MTMFTVNGVVHETREGNQTLLEVLRNELGLSGAKLGCGEGECGACTVLLDGKPICACLQLASSTKGRDVRTVEFVAETEIGREVVRAMVTAGAVQCGFCTPGIVVAASGQVALGLPDSLDAALEGNLCRCTGYAKIRQALETVAIERKTPPQVVTARRDLQLSYALSRLAADSGIIPIAGGTDLLVRHEHDLVEKRFLDLTRLDDPGLAVIRCSDQGLDIGPLVTWTDILCNEDVMREAPLLVEVARTVASAQVRNVGTLAGNIATASPAGDGLVALSALGAELEISHQAYQRRESLADFVTGPGRTSLRRGELITGIMISRQPRGADVRQFFRKVGPRRAQAISKVSLGMVIKIQNGVIQYLRLSFGAVGPTPRMCPTTTSFLLGKAINQANLERASEFLVKEISPINDHRSTEIYRREVAVRLLSDALLQFA